MSKRPSSGNYTHPTPPGTRAGRRIKSSNIKQLLYIIAFVMNFTLSFANDIWHGTNITKNEVTASTAAQKGWTANVGAAAYAIIV